MEVLEYQCSSEDTVDVLLKLGHPEFKLRAVDYGMVRITVSKRREGYDRASLRELPASFDECVHCSGPGEQGAIVADRDIGDGKSLPESKCNSVEEEMLKV